MLNYKFLIDQKDSYSTLFFQLKNFPSFKTLFFLINLELILLDYYSALILFTL